jgi:opacity protein-like surface antigen
MKKILIYSLLLFLIQNISAQRKADFGLFLGGGSYIGDINPGKQFYRPQPAAGLLVRLNINKRFAIRLNGTYVKLSGSANDFPNQVLSYKPGTSFSTNLFDFSTQLEINFLPYITGDKKWLCSTYVSGGIGYTINISGNKNFMTVPFGIGAKINITDRLSAGLEWSYRKTFFDRIDNYESPLGKSILHNNDWYSTYGLFITYKFVKFAADCPVYK